MSAEIIAAEDDLVKCSQCAKPVWVRRDRLEKHIARAHSPTAAPKKSFTTYTAKIASTFPPKVSPSAALPGSRPGTIMLTSRRGRRAGAGCCAECGLEALNIWHYSESNQGPVELCADCRDKVFARSFA